MCVRTFGLPLGRAQRSTYPVLKARAILSRPSGAQILPACPTVPIGNAVLTYTLEAAPFQHGGEIRVFQQPVRRRLGFNFSSDLAATCTGCLCLVATPPIHRCGIRHR